MSPRLAMLAPPLVAAGLVIAEYADTAAHWGVAVRPTLVAMVASILLELLLLALRQPVGRAAGITTALLLLLSGSRYAFVVVGLYAAVALVQLSRHRGLPSLPPLAAVGLAAAFVAAGVVQVFVSGAVVWDELFPPSPPALVATPASGPSIYVLLLDAYGRQDTLEELGFDNEPFLEELERRGFDVYRDSRSNYTWTSSTLASMLNMRPLDEIDTLPRAGEVSDRNGTRALRRAINASAGLQVLRENGYRTVTVPSLADYVVLHSADEVLDSGHLTEFEVHLLQDTILAGVLDVVAPDFIGSQHRDRISRSFDAIRGYTSPTFVLAHVISPHQPFVFDAAGAPVAMPGCFPRCWFWEPWDEFSPEDFSVGYVAAVQHANRATLGALDRVLADDPDAAVVIMGDHGTRALSEDEAFRNLLAVRSPGHPDLLGEAPTPVNVIAHLLSAYLGTDAPLWPEAQFEGRHLDAVPRTAVE